MKTPENAARFESKSRLLAKLVRGLLAREKFEGLADLTEALKVECARLKIRWTTEDISEAYRLLASNRALPGMTPRSFANPQHIERVDDVRPFSRDEARDLYQRVRAALARQRATRGAA
jgi:hypothetical protein